MDESRTSPHAPVGHEQRDVTFRPIIGAAIGMVVVTVVAFLLITRLFDYFAVRAARSSPAANPLASTYGRQLPPEPRLQTAPIKDLLQLHAAEDAVLGTYGWVDKPAGTVRIPIARAMELLAQRGVPTRPDHEATHAR